MDSPTQIVLKVWENRDHVSPSDENARKPVGFVRRNRETHLATADGSNLSHKDGLGDRSRLSHNPSVKVRSWVLRGYSHKSVENR